MEFAVNIGPATPPVLADIGAKRLGSSRDIVGVLAAMRQGGEQKLALVVPQIIEQHGADTIANAAVRQEVVPVTVAFTSEVFVQ